MKKDFLIVGSGLFGAVFAYEMQKLGKTCMVIDRRKHLGGNIYCEKIENINVHQYGAHIFHTNDEKIWNYVHQFVKFNRYTNSPVAIYQDELYNLPFNMNTFYQMWKVKTPQEAQEKIAQQIAHLNIDEPKNLEEAALKMVGTDIYEKLIKGYTEKQWGKSAKDLPAFIIKRLPLRFTFDNNYFNDRFQGIPEGGYNILIEKLLANTEVLLNTDFFSDRAYFESLAEKIVFTGKIDAFYNERFGALEYRSLRFEHEHLETENFQGNAVVNYTEKEIPYTRIIEHKHFEFGTQKTTIITKEYPEIFDQKKEPYYPINDEKNMKIFKQYQVLAEAEKNVIFGGRLAEYRYYDMHQVIASALKKVSEVLEN